MRIKHIMMVYGCITSIHYSCSALKPYEQWWQQNIGTPHMQVLESIHHIHARTRCIMRKYVQKKGYASILDAGCGSGIEYLGFMRDGISIAYQGIDITPGFVDAAQKGKINIIEGSIEELPFKNNSFDIAYVRHVVEHLVSYEQAFTELIRVACKEALIIFFIPPHHYEIDYINVISCNGVPLYNNHYSKKKMERFIKSNRKVLYCTWEKCGAEEELLHIYLKN